MLIFYVFCVFRKKKKKIKRVLIFEQKTDFESYNQTGSKLEGVFAGSENKDKITEMV